MPTSCKGHTTRITFDQLITFDKYSWTAWAHDMDRKNRMDNCRLHCTAKGCHPQDLAQQTPLVPQPQPHNYKCFPPPGIGGILLSPKLIDATTRGIEGYLGGKTDAICKMRRLTMAMSNHTGAATADAKRGNHQHSILYPPPAWPTMLLLNMQVAPLAAPSQADQQCQRQAASLPISPLSQIAKPGSLYDTSTDTRTMTNPRHFCQRCTAKRGHQRLPPYI